MKKRQRCSKVAATTTALAAATTLAALARGMLGFRVTSSCQSSARAKRRHNSTTATTTAATITSSCSAASAWPLPLPLPLLLLLLLANISMHIVSISAVGYSYSRFEGPVAGPEHLVTVQDEYGGGTRSDYVARPEYSFAYGVEDGKTRVLQNRKETRNGDEVQGVYSVVDPDGTLRVVKYTADDVHGFQAEVITNGVATIHGRGSEAAGAAVEQKVEHAEGNEVDAEEPDEPESSDRAPYKVHEDEAEEPHEDGAGDDEQNEEEGDHEEYEGSSEEGYEDAKTQSQQQTSSEEY